ncbi:Cation channel sperm-associated protein 1 [Orchesella cincta]|uniref:Cation channel sperm-associated protein 1 n=1 Tax=Orchesella cincta TaxID=48709 RepID=A0A1D2MEL7_ORCCI|nr:Cation channel sperm-associated protein 1 [Orchesella cincta]
MDTANDSKRTSGGSTGKKKVSTSPQDELHTLWRELVQKARVHEMVKCLQAEKKKLKILQQTVEPDNLDFLEFAAHQQAAKSIAESEGTEEPWDDEVQKSDDVDVVEKVTRSSEVTTRASLTKRDTYAKMGEEHHANIPKSAYNAQRNAAEILSNKPTLTDQEFEDIVELCEDKVEQKALREAFEEKKAREKYLHNADERRTMLYNFINSKFFTNFMLVTIITSIVGIFLLTFEFIAIRFAWPLIMLDSCIIGIFLVEAIFKVTIYKEDYFKQLWNILDMLIIVVHFVELAVDLITRTLALSTDINANIGFKFLKSLRALRLLRVIKFLPNLQVIVATVFQSMLSIGSIALLMLLFIFVFAVMGRGLFFERLPDKFGSLWLSFVTLFQLLTLDDWFELLEENEDDRGIDDDSLRNEGDDRFAYWLMFVYLFGYLVIEFFVFLNLFVAVLVDNFQLTLADAEIQKQKEALEELEAQKKFEDLKKEGSEMDTIDEEVKKDFNEGDQLGLTVEDYFPVDPDSREAELLGEFYKDLNSLDFNRFLWKRRLTLFNMIIDTALSSRANATQVVPEKVTEDDVDHHHDTHKTEDESTQTNRGRLSEKQTAAYLNEDHPSNLPAWNSMPQQSQTRSFFMSQQ